MPKLPIRYWRYKPLGRNADKLAADMLRSQTPPLKLRGLNTICISSTLRPLKWRHEPATGAWHAVRRPWMAIAVAGLFCGTGIGVAAGALYHTASMRMIEQGVSFREAVRDTFVGLLDAETTVFIILLVCSAGVGLCVYALIYAISSAVFERLTLYPGRGMRIDRRSLRGFSRTEIPFKRLKIGFFTALLPHKRPHDRAIAVFILHRGRPHTPLMVWHDPKALAKRIEQLPNPLKNARFFISDRPLKPRIF